MTTPPSARRSNDGAATQGSSRDGTGLAARRWAPPSARNYRQFHDRRDEFERADRERADQRIAERLVELPGPFTLPEPAGIAQVPSPRQKVEADAEVPPLRLPTGRLPAKAKNSPCYILNSSQLHARRHPVGRELEAFVKLARLGADGRRKRIGTLRDSLAITSLKTDRPNARIRRGRGSCCKTLVQRDAGSPLGLADRFMPPIFAVAKLTPHHGGLTNGTSPRRVLKTIDPAKIVSIETRRPIAARWVTPRIPET